jgi:hypothetical protein
MHGVRFKLWFVTLLLLFLASPALAASSCGMSADSLPVFSDFDGDHKLDQAELVTHGAEKSIHVSLGKLDWRFFSFDSGSADRGHLITDDIDRDGDTDLVWCSQTSPRQFVMWLGDGRGNFSIAQGAERDRLQEQLNGVEQSHLTDNADAEESTWELESTAPATVEQTSSLISSVCAHRGAAAITPAYFPCPCLSIRLERGPPTRLT